MSDETPQQPTTSTPEQQSVARPPQPPRPLVTSSQSAVRPKQRYKVVVLIVSVLAAGLLCFGAAYAGNSLSSRQMSGGTADYSNPKNDGNLVVSPDEKNISGLVEKVSPSVVSIVTSVQSSRAGYEAQAAGTGMIVSKDGYVMTNNHVIDDAKSVTVVTSDGKTYDNVKVLGKDPLNDVAFLKISGVNNLQPVTLGDSKTVRTGQSVIAIGNALGQYQNTVTSGIISGLGRPVVASTGEDTGESESLTDLLQTDAAINSGNSGGPLLNLQGQVIGINTAVAQDAQSIGFTIPIGATKGMLNHLIKTGKVERAVIGLQYISITPEVKSKYKLSVDQGDLVQATSGGAIKTGSPADKAGIKEGDIVTKVNGEDVGPGKSISTLVGEFEPGDKVTITLLRGGETKTVSLTLQAY